MPILWLLEEQSSLNGKTPILGKIEGRSEGMIDDEMVGWRHPLNGDEFEQAPGDSEGQETLLWSSPWGHKKLGHD